MTRTGPPPFRRLATLSLATAAFSFPLFSGRAAEEPPPIAGGRTLYVSPSGDDNHPGTTAAPLKSAAAAVAAARPGDTVIVRAGTYPPLEVVGKQGEARRPITIAATGEAVFTSGSYERNAGVQIRNSAYIVLKGLTVSKSLWGILCEGVRQTEIVGCHVYDTGQEAIHVRLASSGVLIADNKVHDTGRRGDKYDVYAEGIYIGTGAAGGERDGTHHVTVRGNTIFRTGTEAVDMKRGLHDIVNASPAAQGIRYRRMGA